MSLNPAGPDWAAVKAARPACCALAAYDNAKRLQPLTAEHARRAAALRGA